MTGRFFGEKESFHHYLESFRYGERSLQAQLDERIDVTHMSVQLI